MKSTLIAGFCFLAILHLCSAVSTDLKSAIIDRKKTKDDASNDVIKLRYFINDENKGDANSPILVHIEYGDDAEKLAKQHGYIFSVAKQLNATLAVLEHRYFGQSLISNKAPQVYTEMTNVGPTEVTDDFLSAIEAIRGTDKQRKIILSGSGYAGELATIIRLNDKTGNDQLIYASIISNAPLLLHEGGGIKSNVFDNNVNEIYKNEGCPMDKLKDAIGALLPDTIKTADFQKILDTLKLAGDADDFNEGGAKSSLLNYIYDAYVGLAHLNYDMSRTVGNMKYDARPVKAFCQKVTSADTGTEIEKKIAPVQLLIDAYYQNSDVQNGKHEFQNKPQLQKTYIECVVSSPYHCTHGPDNDFFKKNCLTTDTDEKCYEKNRNTTCKNQVATFSPDTTPIDFNVMKKALKDFQQFETLQNTIYINGKSDPNNVGVITKADVTKNQYKFDIDSATSAAHLLSPSTCDPDNIKEVRYRTINILNCWLSGTTDGNCDKSKLGADLPAYKAPSETSNCQDQTFNYPWGRDPSDPGRGQQTTKKPSKSNDSSMAPSTGLFVQIPFFILGLFVFFI